MKPTILILAALAVIASAFPTSNNEVMNSETPAKRNEKKTSRQYILPDSEALHNEPIPSVIDQYAINSEITEPFELDKFDDYSDDYSVSQSQINIDANDGNFHKQSQGFKNVAPTPTTNNVDIKNKVSNNLDSSPSEISEALEIDKFDDYSLLQSNIDIGDKDGIFHKQSQGFKNVEPGSTIKSVDKKNEVGLSNKIEDPKFAETNEHALRQFQNAIINLENKENPNENLSNIYMTVDAKNSIENFRMTSQDSDEIKQTNLSNSDELSGQLDMSPSTSNMNAATVIELPILRKHVLENLSESMIRNPYDFQNLNVMQPAYINAIEPQSYNTWTPLNRHESKSQEFNLMPPFVRQVPDSQDFTFITASNEYNSKPKDVNILEPSHSHSTKPQHSLKEPTIIFSNPNALPPSISYVADHENLNIRSPLNRYEQTSVSEDNTRITPSNPKNLNALSPSKNYAVEPQNINAWTSLNEYESEFGSKALNTLTSSLDFDSDLRNLNQMSSSDEHEFKSMDINVSNPSYRSAPEINNINSRGHSNIHILDDEESSLPPSKRHYRYASNFNSNEGNGESYRDYSKTPYNFEYAVNDDYNNNYYGHREGRNNEIVEGSYYVNLPDSRRMTVNYYVDDWGYHPTVSFEGTAIFPSPDSSDYGRK